jgi:hypothetical protein
MFGLSSTLAPKLNGVKVGFPYVTQFLMERNAKRLADAAAAPKEARPGEPKVSVEEAVALVN